mgnify:CR=1 FL=1
MQSIKDTQPFGRNTTKHQAAFQKKRNNQTRDHMSKATQKMIQYCIQKEVGTLIVGYNNMFQQSWPADEYLTHLIILSQPDDLSSAQWQLHHG